MNEKKRADKLEEVFREKATGILSELIGKVMDMPNITGATRSLSAVSLEPT